LLLLLLLQLLSLVVRYSAGCGVPLMVVVMLMTRGVVARRREVATWYDGPTWITRRCSSWSTRLECLHKEKDYFLENNQKANMYRKYSDNQDELKLKKGNLPAAVTGAEGRS
jgi:hypothetical protein